MAFVPLLWAWREATLGQAALYGFTFGLGFFGVLLEWSRYFGVVAIAPFVLATAAYFAGAGALVALFARRGIRGPWIVAAIWVVVEGLMARWPLGGFPWGEVGVALHDVGPARALASVGGVPLVSFFVVVWNGLLLDAILALRARQFRPVVWAVSGLLGVTVLTVVADVTRYEPRVTGSVRFAMLQGWDQNREATSTEFANDDMMKRHLKLASGLEGSYDIIVFPESALERDPTTNPDVRERLLEVASEHDAVILANARVPTDDGGIANANVVYSPDGTFQGIYAKQHLVPFGEYIPLRDALSFIPELDQIPYDFEAGDRRTLFRTDGHRFGTVICFESAFAPLVRDNVRDGAEFLVVNTSNRSFRRSGLAAQHLALSQMRAAETARPILHASISGISGVVDADGDVHDTSELFVNKVTNGSIETAQGRTLAVRLGDWVLLLALLALLVGATVAAWRQHRSAVVES